MLREESPDEGESNRPDMTEQHSIFTDICGLAEDEQLTVVIPAFNEEKTIGDVIRGVKSTRLPGHESWS